MALDKLPSELLHFIVQNLPRQGDRFALILSCRRFHEILLPTLYSKVRLFKYIDTKWYSFIRTIAQNPSLAEAVTQLFIGSFEVPGDEIQIFGIDPNLTSRLLDNINQLDIDERDEWEEDANIGIADAWLGLILPQLPNLRRMDVVIPHGAWYFHKILRKAARRNVQAFLKLEEAYMSWYSDKGGVPPSYLMPFFHFPNMWKLRGSKISEMDLEESESFTRDMGPLRRINSSGITHLEFENSNNTEDGMIRLIGSCKELKSFSLGYGGVMVSDEEFLPRALVESLSKRHKRSLERLWVENDCDDTIEEDELVGSLVEFTALKHLHIRLPNLLGFGQDGDVVSPLTLKDVLPPSITTLSLSCCEQIHLQHLSQQLDELIQSRQESQLVKLGIQAYRDVTQTDPLVEQMRAMCSTAGIRFKFVTGMYFHTQEEPWEREEPWESDGSF